MLLPESFVEELLAPGGGGFGSPAQSRVRALRAASSGVAPAPTALKSVLLTLPPGVVLERGARARARARALPLPRPPAAPRRPSRAPP